MGLPTLVKTGRLYQYIATFTGCLTVMCMGMHLGWPSPSLPRLLKDPDSRIKLTSSDGSWIAVMPLVGTPLGGILGALLLDRVGRKVSLLIVSPIYFVCWLMVGFSVSLTSLNIARFIVGLGDGISFTALPVYVGEISDSHIRGFLGSSIVVINILGVVLINLIGSYFNISFTALISSIFPVIHFITFFWMPETPYFLLMKKKEKEAANSLRIFKGPENVDSELARLKLAVEEEMAQSTGSNFDLFTQRSNRRGVLIIAILRGAQQFSGYTTILFYAQIIFDEAGGMVSPTTSTIIYFTVQMIVAGFCSMIVDKTGRRPLLIFSSIGASLALVAEGLYFYFKLETDYDMTSVHFIPLAALLVFIILFLLGLGTIPTLMLGEVFPTNVKAVALCLAEIYYAAVVTLVSKCFQYSKDHYGMYYPFFGFAICCIIGVVLIIFFIPETKGQTLEDIQNQLKSRSNAVKPIDTYLNGSASPHTISTKL